MYVSRKDTTPSGDVITTFDIRMTEPNRQEPLSGKALHAIEHLAATYLRNHPQWRDKVIYWGPMGCRTGNYLLLSGDYESADIVPLMRETFRFIADFEGDIPVHHRVTAAITPTWIFLRPRRKPLSILKKFSTI